MDPNIFKAMIQQESGFREGVKSGAGAQDIAQFMPATAKAYGVTLGDGRVTDDLEGAAKYIAANLKRTGGNYHEALSIYNSGRPDAYRNPGFAGGQTYNYVRTILANAGHTPSPASRGSAQKPSSSRTVGQVDNSQNRAALVRAFLDNGNPSDTAGTGAAGLESRDPLQFALGISQLQDDPGHRVTTTRTVRAASSGYQPPKASTSAKGVGTFEGKKVAAWIAPVLEYARQRGWKGTINSGYRSYADQSRIYASGVRPAAKPGTSNHEFTAFPGGAVDVSDAAVLSHILKTSPYSRKLVWAGSKDPVHFSHPHNGAY